MDKKEFYKTDKPLTVRESFNNTILLLSMVKSEYYYIIGFSRSEGIIEIGFDFESKLHGKITEIIILDFYSYDYCIELSCNLTNIDVENIKEIMNSKTNKLFLFDNNSVIYKSKISSDKLIPTSINAMNSFILQAKCDISAFLESYYKRCISAKQCYYENSKGNI